MSICCAASTTETGAISFNPQITSVAGIARRKKAKKQAKITTERKTMQDNRDKGRERDAVAYLCMNENREVIETQRRPFLSRCFLTTARKSASVRAFPSMMAEILSARGRSVSISSQSLGSIELGAPWLAVPETLFRAFSGSNSVSK